MKPSIKLWRNQKHTRALLGRIGYVVAFTKVYTPPAGFESQVPYVCAIVKMGEKCHVGQIVDIGDKKIETGQKVISVLRRMVKPGKKEVIPYGVKFKLVSQK